MPLEGALQAQLGGWFSALDPTTKAIFEQFWSREPQLVASVLTDDQWKLELGDGAKTLAELLAASAFGGGADRVGLQLVGVETTPSPPLADGDVGVSLMMMAPEAGQVGFSGSVTWTGPVSGTAELTGGPMQPWGTQGLEFTIPAAPAGRYNLAIEANPDGAEPGSPPNANGVRFSGAYDLEVVSADAAAEEQTAQATQYGVGALGALLNPAFWESTKDAVLDGLNYLVAVPDPALVSAVGDVYGPLSELEQAGVVGAVHEAMTAVGVAAQQVDWPYQGAPDLSTVTRSLTDLVAALAAAAEAQTAEGETEET
ncbi:MAG: hypothetical protein H0W25_04350 [Acidimicrobiia bacterium]|nr:hypothetical protein [Acidimicrobiia bacterium]